MANESSGSEIKDLFDSLKLTAQWSPLEFSVFFFYFKENMSFQEISEELEIEETKVYENYINGMRKINDINSFLLAIQNKNEREAHVSI